MRDICFDDAALKGKKFKCLEQCGMCCRMFRIPLFKEDIERIETFLSVKSDHFAEIIKESHAARIILPREQEEEIVLLKTTAGGNCIFFDSRNSRCTIYEARPLACRLYPLRFYKKSEKVIKIVLDPLSEMFCGWEDEEGKEFTKEDYLQLWMLLRKAYSSRARRRES